MRNMNSLTIAERHAIANEHLEACADILTNPKVAKALGAHADRLIQILDWMYVPNMRNGVYEAPRRFRDGPRIPLVVVTPGDESAYRTDNLINMHPEQSSNLEVALKNTDQYELDDQDIDIDQMTYEIIRSAKTRYGEIRSIGGDFLDGAMACVTTGLGKLHKPGDDDYYIWVATRPMVVVGSHSLVDEGTVLAHENTHVHQFLDETLIYEWRKNEATRVELPANHVEYEALRAKYDGHIPPQYWYIERKEKVRILANGTGENAFRATPKLLKVMARYGYDETFGHLPRQPREIPISTVQKMKNKHGRVGVKVKRG